MRKIILLGLPIFFFLSSFEQYHFTPPALNPQKQANSNAVIRLLCCSSSSVTQPLYIIDGLLSDSSVLKSLAAKDILRIDILKGADATALYGYQAEAGVIIISTRRSKCLIIEDKDNHSTLAGATVKVLSDSKREDGRLLIANENGEIDLSNLNDKKNYKVVVSCIGYKAKTISITNKSNFLIQLEKDYKNLKEITLVSYPTIHCKSLCVCYSSFSKRNPSNEKELPLRSDFSVFPNPVSKLAPITIKLLHPIDGEAEIISTSGQVIKKIKMDSDKNLYPSIALNNVNAGIYFISCTDAHLKKIFTEKLIVQ